MIKAALSILCACLVGCGYHFDPATSSSSERIAINIPYIKGDHEGVLLSALAQAMGESGAFEYVYSGGNCALSISIISDSDDRIGYRYDRNPTNGTLRDNIVGTENRRTLAATIQLVDENTQEILLGPETVQVNADYDYFDGNSIRDLVVFQQPDLQTTLSFSLGQLDSVEGAHDDTNASIYGLLADKIVSRLFISRLFSSK
jgi:hypothetical protein